MEKTVDTWTGLCTRKKKVGERLAAGGWRLGSASQGELQARDLGSEFDTKVGPTIRILV